MAAPTTITIATYKVAMENQEQFFTIMRRRRQYLLAAYYMTRRDPIVMRSRKDPTVIVEVFEWVSEERIAKAREDSRVVDGYRKEMTELWEDGGFSLGQLPEADDPFAGYDAVSVY